MTPRPRIIGIGNPAAGDDGVGLAVIAALRSRGEPDRDLHEVHDAATLIPLLHTRAPVLLVDAVACDRPPGELLLLCESDLARPRLAPWSTHGIEVQQAIALARALAPDATTSELRILGISIAAPDRTQRALSPAVEAAVAPAAALAASFPVGDRPRGPPGLPAVATGRMGYSGATTAAAPGGTGGATMTFRSLDLKSIPLFARIPDAHLEQLVSALETVTFEPGATIFTAGSVADRFLLLVEGEVEVRWDGERLTVRPFAPVGELGALAGLRRATTAVATTPSALLTIPTGRLIAFFQANGEIGFRFQDNLMHILADKIDRDRRHVEEMKRNIVSTQKAMKRMRDGLLEAEDTELHRTMFEELDSHIEHNRRGRYLVEVPRALPMRLRIDGERTVRRISNEKLQVSAGPGAPLAAGAAFTAVLVAPDTEIPISGTVDSVQGDQVSLSLDALIEESAQQLEKLLARLQLLDVVL